MEGEPKATTDAYRALLDEVGAFVYSTDLNGHYTYANRLVLQLLGQSSLEAVLGKSFTDFVDIGEAGATLRDTDLRVLRGGETISREEINQLHATGEVRTYWTQKKPLRDADGVIIGMLGISHDITEKKHLEDKLRDQKELLNAVLDNIDGLVYVKGADRRFRYANRGMAATFGLPVERIIGARDTDLMPREVADAWWAKDEQILATGKRYAGEESMLDAAGRRRHYWSVVVPWRDFDGAPGLIGLITDITQLQALRQELERQTRTDSLTGIANRRAFFERAEQEFSRCQRHGTPLSLLAIDIDHFKQINDAYGHPAGDAVLQRFAARCRETLRSEDLCARTGGEEFCILLPDARAADAHATAERIRQLLREHPVSDEHPELRITASFGIAGLGAGDANFGALFSRADRALYAAKQAGRDRSVLLRCEAVGS